MIEKYRMAARLHSQSIDQGFLSSLGTRFLSLMYQAIDEADNSTLIVASEGGKIIGFVSGTLGIGEVYRAMLKHRIGLAVALLPSLFSLRRVRRILEIAFYGRRKARKNPEAGPEVPDAELLSISVDGAYRGKKHSDRLFQDLVGFFRSKNIPRFKIIVGASLAPAHSFYRRMGAKPAGTTEVHKGEISTIYIYEVN